jgi:phosphatidylserine decarboxylase
MAKEGLNLVIGTLVLSLIMFFFSVLVHSGILFVMGGFFIALALFFIFFFRDPERKIPQGENLVLAPADGKVISLKGFSEDEFLASSGTRLSIFLSLWDPHVNRNPISGVVQNFEYRPGKFHPAFKEKASLRNEQTEIWLENDHVKVIMKQIAGILARRVVCRLKPGDKVLAGERLGMIKFGSRVDLFLPEDVRIEVHLNERVKAGETIIGRY